MAAQERWVPPALTHPPGLLHVPTWQPLHKVDASQWRARGGQEDGGVHHEILHVHGLHLEERRQRKPHQREEEDGAGYPSPSPAPRTASE